MGSKPSPLGVCGDFPWARNVLVKLHKSAIMSVRAHLWLRIAGLVIILAAQFGPRIWAPSGAGASAGAGTKIASAEAR